MILVEFLILKEICLLFSSGLIQLLRLSSLDIICCNITILILHRLSLLFQKFLIAYVSIIVWDLMKLSIAFCAILISRHRLLIKSIRLSHWLVSLSPLWIIFWFSHCILTSCICCSVYYLFSLSQRRLKEFLSLLV